MVGVAHLTSAQARNCRDNVSPIALVFSRNSRGRPNVLTLSCKSRRPCRPPGTGTAPAATNNEVAGANCSRRDAGMQFGAAQGGSAAEPRLGGFCQLVGAGGARHGLLSLSRNF